MIKNNELLYKLNGDFSFFSPKIQEILSEVSRFK